MVDPDGVFNFFQGIHVRIDIRTDIPISKTYDHQTWQAGTYTRSDSSETNQAGDSDAITSRSRSKLKTYLHYQSVYGHQTWQHGNLP